MTPNRIFETKEEKDALHIDCFGSWNKESINPFLTFLDTTPIDKKLTIDIAQVVFLDTSGAMALLLAQKKIESKGLQGSIVGANENASKLLNLCKQYDCSLLRKKNLQYNQSPFTLLGKGVVHSLSLFLAFLSFVGAVLVAFIKTLARPSSMRFKATLYHLEKNGLNAVPIIAITSLLIGVVIAYQGAVQLKQFGANIFIVEMIGISATRELAPLIAAIVIAGRSASAFTAQIGVMKLTDEIDAMRTMGFRVWEFLVLPRVIALVIAMPLLVIIANCIAIFGGMIIAYSELGITYVEFLDRFRETVAMKHILIGLFKAPIFGLIIALVGCYRGFQINSSTESVGKYTTISVVNAIFWVIAFNALFSVVLTEIGL